MTLPTSGLWRVACSLPRLNALSLLLALVLTAADAQAATGEAAAITYETVSPPHRAAEIGYFGTSPESPDGRKIAYVAYDEKPGSGSAVASGGSLFLCDTDLTNHVKIRAIGGLRWEDGASQIWIDNDTIAYMAHPPGGVPVTYVVNQRGDVLCGPLEGCLGHGDTPNATVLLLVDRRQYPNGSKLGRGGIYAYKGGVVTPVVDLERDLGRLKDRLEGSDDPREWFMFHAQLSTNGTYISIRLDTVKNKEYLVTCRADGTDVRLFAAQKKPLHQQWFDDATIFGQETVFKPADGGPRHRSKRWDRDGAYIETLAGVGNHPGISPDRRYLASDNLYESDPVVIRLYRTRSIEPLAVIMSEAQGNVWKLRTHVNPTFSRDGKRVYFNKPVAGMPQVVRANLGNMIHTRD